MKITAWYSSGRSWGSGAFEVAGCLGKEEVCKLCCQAAKRKTGPTRATRYRSSSLSRDCECEVNSKFWTGDSGNEPRRDAALWRRSTGTHVFALTRGFQHTRAASNAEDNLDTTNNDYKRQVDLPAAVDGAWHITLLCQILLRVVLSLCAKETHEDASRPITSSMAPSCRVAVCR